eukprot:136937-Chlamydomonas_euryale.AAC.2
MKVGPRGTPPLHPYHQLMRLCRHEAACGRGGPAATGGEGGVRIESRSLAWRTWHELWLPALLRSAPALHIAQRNVTCNHGPACKCPKAAEYCFRGV